jgi:hypothetical protein
MPFGPNFTLEHGAIRPESVAVKKILALEKAANAGLLATSTFIHSSFAIEEEIAFLNIIN